MVRTKQKNPGWLDKLLKRYAEESVLALGFPVGTNGVSARYPEGASVLMVAMVNNFGASINHPGGTRYNFDKSGKAVFVSNSFVGPTQGVTKAHVINVPARGFMNQGAVPAVEATNPIKEALIPALNAGKITKEQILEHMGQPAADAFKKIILTGDYVANAASTILKKGSARPLNDTGLMRQTFTYVVRKPQ